jgi:hypothetical protein
MPPTSPLEQPELRQIEKLLDEGDTREAAARLGAWVDARDHKLAIDFLTTRLLFQRGRIDSHGAADRLVAILDQVDPFPEADDWLAELEARTERSALDVPAFAEPVEADDEELDESTTPTQPPPSRAPSIPRKAERFHPYVDATPADDDDDVTPTESLGTERDVINIKGLVLDSSEPPPRRDDNAVGLTGEETPTRPGRTGTRPAPQGTAPRRDTTRSEPIGSEPPTRPSHMPFDKLRAKEQLSAQAGRYRGASNRPGEVMGGARKSRSPTRNPAGIPPDPERRIREALQHVKDGLLEEARARIPDEPLPANLRPEARTALARVLLELDQAERASVQASLALEQAPQATDTRLVFVWSAVRYARQRDDAWSLERAGRLLKELPQAAALDAGLVDALTACIEARVGVPAVALRLAQRSLRTHADSIDGLAALAEAAALCGEERRAEAALEQLFSVSESAAAQIAPRLQRMGVGKHGPASSASVWLPLEHTLSSGAREAALAGLEALADETLAGLVLERLEDSEATASIARKFFTLAPVLRHFGPYDGSLRSIERLEAGLSLVYGSGPRALDVAGAGQGLWQISGLYLGETLRQCCKGHWHENPDLLKDAGLTVLGFDVQPFQIVRHRIAHGRRSTLKAALAGVLEAAPSAARAFHSTENLAPSAPWGDRHWPDIADMPHLGRALGHSVIAVYAVDRGHAVLDRSSKSLRGLDEYLELVAPAGAPSSEGADWARWLSVFLGAYLGEVMCKEFNAIWVAADQPDAEAFAVEWRDRRVTPVAFVLKALGEGQPVSLADYVEQQRQGLAPA